jgi:hypothetical protein
MIWIAITIIIISYLIIHTTRQLKEKEFNLKEQELEANPQYRMKIALESEIKIRKRHIADLDRQAEDALKILAAAEKNGNKNEVKRLNDMVKKYHIEANDEERKIKIIQNKLSYGISLPIFKYNFVIEDITLHAENFRYTDNERLKNKKIQESIKELNGLSISIIHQDLADFPHQGEWDAKSKAEDKGSEIVATLLDMTYGGNQLHQRNENNFYGLQGKFVYCKLVSVEQVN